MLTKPCPRYTFYNAVESPPQITNRYHRVEEFFEFVFSQADLHSSFINPDFFRSRSILTWRNDMVADLNSQVLQDLSGEEQIFGLVNYTEENGTRNNAHELPTEFLQSINVASFPPAQLRLKIGTPHVDTKFA